MEQGEIGLVVATDHGKVSRNGKACAHEETDRGDAVIGMQDVESRGPIADSQVLSEGGDDTCRAAFAAQFHDLGSSCGLAEGRDTFTVAGKGGIGTEEREPLMTTGEEGSSGVT